MSAIEEPVIFRHGKDRNFTKEEYFALDDEMWAAKRRGDEETYERIARILPANPDVVKAFKEVYGKEYILSMGLDLTEANLRFGEGWLDAPDE